MLSTCEDDLESRNGVGSIPHEWCIVFEEQTKNNESEKNSRSSARIN